MDPKKLDELTAECVYGKRPDVCACKSVCQYLHGGPIAGCRRSIGEDRPRGTVTEHGTWFDEGVTVMKDVRRTDLSEKSIRLSDALPNRLPNVPQLGTNPKDRLGAKKIDLGIVPAVGIWHEAAAFFDGGIEYDPFNWRENKVLARIYIAAMRRHIDEWESGIEETSDTRVHHLGAVRACANILLDAQMTGNLIDNRPKAPAFAVVVEKLNAWAKARVAKGRYRNV